MSQESYWDAEVSGIRRSCVTGSPAQSTEKCHRSGYQRPAPANAPAFDAAVEDVAAVTHRLLAALPRP
ncbi:MAG: DUF2277 family protein [Dehalococcoidia bacterium]|nr:MAG: DUF2277 family protein [Dehalococcoidia bacterium]